MDIEKILTELHIEYTNRKREFNKSNYQNNRDKILTNGKKKFECICGGRYTLSNKSKHLNSKKHLKWKLKYKDI